MALCIEPKSAFLDHAGIVRPITYKVRCVEFYTRPSLEVRKENVKIIVYVYALFLKEKIRDFPGGPVARALCSHCRGPGFDPWSGNWIPHVVTKRVLHTTRRTHVMQLGSSSAK